MGGRDAGDGLARGVSRHVLTSLPVPTDERAGRRRRGGGGSQAGGVSDKP
jgi:hypothetical protein